MKNTSKPHYLIIIMIFFIFSTSLCSPARASEEPCSSLGSQKTVAIIGGGMAGVAAASFLKGSPYRVILFESQDQLGGHAQTTSVQTQHNTLVNVDLGPQYFAKGPWNLYIEFLKYHHLYNKQEMFSFIGRLTTSTSEEAPYLVTPKCPNMEKLLFNLHTDKLQRLYSFYLFNKKAYEFLKSSTPSDYLISVEQWLNSHHFNKKDQENLFLPFLGSMIGVDNEHARKLSMLSLAKLFAFSHPLRTKRYTIFKHGMGHIIQLVGHHLESDPSISIFRSTTVTAIKHDSHRFHIFFNKAGNPTEQKITVDKVITALHPYQLKTLLPENDLLLPFLRKLRYTKNHIVLHNNTLFHHGSLSSVIDIQSQPGTKPFLTMNLHKINKAHYGPLCKSWINDKTTYRYLRDTHSILGEATFMHPYVTTSFVRAYQRIATLLATQKKYKDLAIAGGWTEFTETQSTAIASAYKAVQKLCPEWASKARWKQKLPALSSAC